jgi:predicted PurR-regulated permease PerM
MKAAHMNRWDKTPTPRMQTSELIRRTVIVAVTVLAVIGLTLLFIEVRGIVLWILVGVILAIALHPGVEWLVRHGLNRVLAALLVSVAAVALIAAAIMAILWPVILQSDDFIRELPQIVQSIFGPGGRLHFLEVRFDVLERLAAVSPEQVAQALLGSQDTIVTALTRAASLLAATITILTIMVMLLMQGNRAWASILDMLVDEERVWGERIGRNFLQAVGGYVRGNLIISIVAGIVSYIVLKILGVPYAETLAVTVAILDVIPLVGATIAAIIVTIVGFAAAGTTQGIILLVYFVAYQQFENNVLQNMVYAKTVSLSPLVVFIAALIGASLGGIVGVLLAIPLASAGWSLGRDLIALRQARHAAWAAAELPFTEVAAEHPGHEPALVIVEEGTADEEPT